MKKTLLALLVVSMLCTMLGVFTAGAAEIDAIIFDLSVEPTYTKVSEDATLGEVWTISWADGLAFLGKNSKARISYAYDSTEKASVFRPYPAQKDPYFVASVAGGTTGADMPAKYQFDTSVYKYAKIVYKAKTSATDAAKFFWIGTGTKSTYDEGLWFLQDKSRCRSIWQSSRTGD